MLGTGNGAELHHPLGYKLSGLRPRHHRGQKAAANNQDTIRNASSMAP
jgi:hypothetical protein